MKQENERPSLTVEDLLRLKRAERPGPDFWARFDQELRTKQLAALVKREPWWSRLAQGWSAVSRYRVAAGATAILALSFVTARQYRGVHAPVTTAVAVQAPVPASVVVNILPATPAPAESAALPAFTVATNDAPEPVSIEKAEEPKPAEARSHLVSLLAAANAPELIAASLAATEAAVPSVTRSMFGLSTGSESRLFPARRSDASEPHEPLADMRHPTDVKRIARVEAMMAMANQMDVASRLGVPATSRVSFDERMYEEQPGRLKVGGDKASFNTTLKF